MGTLGLRDICVLNDDKCEFDEEEDDSTISDPPFDVNAITGKDLSVINAPGWYRYRPFHIEYERSMKLSQSNVDAKFLIPGEEPVVGMDVCLR